MTIWKSTRNPAQFALVAASLLTLGVAGSASPAGATTQSHYGVTIAKQKTQNMTLSNGVYSATADGAVLNFQDLQNALAAGNVEVTTGNGAAGDEMGDLHVNAGFTWTSKHALTLDAYHSIFVNAAAVDAGKGALTLTNNDGGTGGDFYYTAQGGISIWNLNNVLTINGQRYLLDSSIQSLAGDILAKPAGFFALASSYDASKDGTYSASPITTEFTGTFEGLGNTISNLTINGTTIGGLFLQAGGTLRDLHLEKAAITAQSGQSWVGALIGIGSGLIDGVTVSGKVTSASEYPVGGLMGGGNGTLLNCSSTAIVRSLSSNLAGGLVGSGTNVTNSFATGAVSAASGDSTAAGGLAGEISGSAVVLDSHATGTVTLTGNGSKGSAGGLVGSTNAAIVGSFASGAVLGPAGTSAGGLLGVALNGYSISNSYSTAGVSAGTKSNVGGLIGELPKTVTGTVATSYATGAPTAGTNSWIGGLLGLDATKGGCGCFSDAYWDMTTSGITNAAQGAGFPPNEPGITGLTTAQLQAALPSGFNPSIWAENPSINNGLPYLIANPPPK